MNLQITTQLSLFGESLDEWTNDDWETPNDEAKAMAELTKRYEVDILEPAAGSGQIVQFIPPDECRNVTALELKPSRVKTGRDRCPNATWFQGDYLKHEFDGKFDLIITNPPFLLRMEYIERSLLLLKPKGRLLFLMPIDFYCGLKGDIWKSLGCRIDDQWTIQNRVSYLNKNGTPQPGRRVYDAVFDIRVGSKKHFLL